MKRNVFILMLFTAFFHSNAQNLVPNYSFEDTIHCPDAAYDFQGYISNWGGEEPGYFSPYCNDGGVGGMPHNVWGYQYPHTGHAYTGIYTYCLTGKDTTTNSYKVLHNLRYYIQVQLISSLISATKYYVAFYVSLGDSCNYACNNIGAYFSDSLLYLSGYALSYHTPQVANDTTHHLTDTLNWVKISGSFIAQGGEQYVTIGNFNTDEQNDTINLGKVSITVPATYMYIDDVIVSTDSNYADSLFTTIQTINKPKEIVEVYPNPSGNGMFTIAVENEKLKVESTVEVYNMLGQQVYSNSFSTSNSQLSINISNQPAGIYLYRITSEKGELVGSGKLIVQ